MRDIKKKTSLHQRVENSSSCLFHTCKGKKKTNTGVNGPFWAGVIIGDVATAPKLRRFLFGCSNLRNKLLAGDEASKQGDPP